MINALSGIQLYCIVITTTALMLPGVAPPAWDITDACMGMLAVRSAAIFYVMLEPVPLSVPVPASRMATATFVAEPLFM